MSLNQILLNQRSAGTRGHFLALDRVFQRLLLACLLSVWGAATPALAQEANANAQPPESAGAPVAQPVALTVEGISVRASDDYPRVLNILPWQAPSVSTRARDPLSMEPSGLLDPVDPVVLQRHQQFRKTLDPLAEPVSQP